MYIKSGNINISLTKFLRKFKKRFPAHERGSSKECAMAGQVYAFRDDIHLYPLYLKFASQSFKDGNASQGMDFFNLACHHPHTLEHKVYKQLWKIHNRPQGKPDYGRNAFHGTGGSSLQEKTRAIEMSLKKANAEEMQMQENKIHECLWKIKGEPPGDLEYGKHAFYNSYGYQYNASFEEKLSAMRKYAIESRISTWFSENKEIRLFRYGNRIKYIGLDPISGRTWEGPLPCGGRPIDTVLSSLPEFEMSLNEDVPSFSRPREAEEWPDPAYIGNKQVKLFWKKENDHLIWHVFDRSINTSSWVFAGHDAVQALHYLSSIPASERASHLRDFSLYMDFDPSTGRLLSAAISRTQASIPLTTPPLLPVTACSKLDSSKIIDQDNWAITLISHGASSTLFGIPIKPNFGHAMIIYEGIENGRYFVRYAHLTNGVKNAPKGQGIVQVEELDPLSNVSYRKKTETWIKPRALVKSIEEEKGRCIPFRAIGDHPFIPDYLEEVKKYNCLTWAVEKLRGIRIGLPSTKYREIVAAPDEYIKSITYPVDPNANPRNMIVD